MNSVSTTPMQIINVKFLGGAKKSFPTGHLKINQPTNVIITVSELLHILQKLKPENTPELDTANILVAINGADSSALGGMSAVIKNGDSITIIPVIHGGSKKNITNDITHTHKRLLLYINKKNIQMVKIRGGAKNVRFLDDLRGRYPQLQLQAISHDFILGASYAKKILEISIESERRGILLSNKLEIDILMRFAMTAQISAAIANVGINSKKPFVLIAISKTKDVLDTLYKELLPILDVSFMDNKNDAEFLKKYFCIDKNYFNATDSSCQLEDILVEKAALLTLCR